MSAPRIVLETNRLRLRHLALDDAAFILRLVNEPSWLRNIGDRGVRNLDDARRFLADGPMAMYAQHGFGQFCVELKASVLPIGLCGLLKRDALAHPDIGFAFLPDYWRMGYAAESAFGVLRWARETLAIETFQAVVAPANVASAQLLESKLGFCRDGEVTLEPGAGPLHLYTST